MNKTKKILKFLAIVLGACNNAMTIFIPIAVALLLIKTLDAPAIYGNFMLILGGASALFRGLHVWLDWFD